MAEPPTLAQVAAAAGVSQATASRVLTGSVRVSTTTRLQVYDAMSRLGYVRQRAIRGGAPHRRGGCVTAIVCDPLGKLFADPYYARFLTAAGQALAEQGVQLAVMAAPTAASAPPVPIAGAEGVLLIGARERHPLAVRLASSGVPLCVVGRPPHDLRLPFVDVDNFDGGRQVAEHLLLSGRRSFAAIAGPPSLPAAQDRTAGFVRTLRGAGVPEIPVAHGDFSAASGAHAMQWLLRHAPGVDAVFAGSDLMAFGALQVLGRAGRRVPAEVAVVGFDDSPPARRSAPPLTTVRQPIEEIAVTAVRALLSGAATGQVLPVELVVRDSG